MGVFCLYWQMNFDPASLHILTHSLTSLKGSFHFMDSVTVRVCVASAKPKIVKFDWYMVMVALSLPEIFIYLLVRLLVCLFILRGTLLK